MPCRTGRGLSHCRTDLGDAQRRRGAVLSSGPVRAVDGPASAAVPSGPRRRVRRPRRGRRPRCDGHWRPTSTSRPKCPTVVGPRDRCGDIQRAMREPPGVAGRQGRRGWTAGRPPPGESISAATREEHGRLVGVGPQRTEACIHLLTPGHAPGGVDGALGQETEIGDDLDCPPSRPGRRSGQASAPRRGHRPAVARRGPRPLPPPPRGGPPPRGRRPALEPLLHHLGNPPGAPGRRRRRSGRIPLTEGRAPVGSRCGCRRASSTRWSASASGVRGQLPPPFSSRAPSMVGPPRPAPSGVAVVPEPSARSRSTTEAAAIRPSVLGPVRPRQDGRGRWKISTMGMSRPSRSGRLDLGLPGCRHERDDHAGFAGAGGAPRTVDMWVLWSLGGS